MRNKSIVLLIISLLLSISIASADDSSMSDSDDNKVMSGSGMYMKNLREAKDEAKMSREEIKNKKNQLKEEVKSKKEEIKENRDEYKKDRGELKEIFSEVNDEQKEELKTIREEHKTKVEEIKEKLKNKELTTDEREALRIELDKEIQSYAEAVKEIVWENAEVESYVDSRLELRDKNKSVREEIRNNREEFRWERSKLVLEFKETYYWKIAQVAPKLSDAKLEKLSTQIDSLIAKAEANTKLSQENKDKMVAQLTSLKEIIDEELETREILSEDIELEIELD